MLIKNMHRDFIHIFCRRLYRVTMIDQGEYNAQPWLNRLSLSVHQPSYTLQGLVVKSRCKQSNFLHALLFAYQVMRTHD